MAARTPCRIGALLGCCIVAYSCSPTRLIACPESGTDRDLATFTTPENSYGFQADRVSYHRPRLQSVAWRFYPQFMECRSRIPSLTKSGTRPQSTATSRQVSYHNRVAQAKLSYATDPQRFISKAVAICFTRPAQDRAASTRSHVAQGCADDGRRHSFHGASGQTVDRVEWRRERV